ncbi:hypothetical protein BT93_L5841 [Corymbia citriodora subsp. variegata]|uniref:Leucine-rich repeat-containing N-terminal plant-type domain-containing protein n=1 Tax=Corymbia citriodora subsp. variegata TaxID=360336 RepID=A0A8T0CTL6_CORYI|nr:hypothetical protein BT93_L5841 [Corymbia citriodora subsp. variegata]
MKLAAPLLIAVSLILVHPVFSSGARPTSRNPKCHENERSALLEFKSTFFNKSLCDSYYHPIAADLESWRVTKGEGEDCCAWDGVECNDETGRVIGLNLEHSCLYGPIGSNASLFHLVHLRRLNLAYNDFKSSQIPSAIGNLRELTSLVLSVSRFYGQIPREVLNLTYLSFLDLSYNDLELKSPSLENLLRSLTKLEGLNLSNVSMSSPLPDAIADLSNLTSLVLEYCSLKGELPVATFELPRLETLDVSWNENLSVRMPEFRRGNPLKSLSLSETRCSGQLPSSLGNLSSLIELDIARCELSGVIPSSVGELARLHTLDLSENQLTGEILHSLGKLVGLTNLHLNYNQLSGEIPPSLGKLVGLTYLDLGSNQLSGEILPSLGKLVGLTYLYLSSNQLSGEISPSLGKLVGLTELCLRSNQLSGEIPSSLMNLAKLDTLKWIDLSYNRISGQVPQWLLNVSTENLAHLNLSNNSLTGFSSYPVEFKWANLWTLDIRYNGMEGPLPLLPRSIVFYLASNNKLTGQISLAICQLNSISILDLANNEFLGVLPSCLGNLSNTLSTLSLHGNRFYGRIPQLKGACELKMVDLSDNQFEGPLPRGLSMCVELEFLNLGNNQIVETFPSWLGSLPNLKEPQSNHQYFPKLRIIDLSMNNFSGGLPSKYFDSWNAMKFTKPDEVVYYANHIVEPYSFANLFVDYDYSMTILNKGIELKYDKILEYLTVIDFSSNGFVGEIPSSIGSLMELHLLNLSHNAIADSIPSSLRNLTKLEALDLSKNELTGKIPPELTQLTSLEFFDVSDNHLSGPIPREKQFNTFENSSYKGNSGLCGAPLTKKCNDLKASPPPPSDGVSVKEEPRTWIKELNWKVVLMGFASGSIIGVVVGLNYTVRIERWFVNEFCQGKQRRRRRHRRRRRVV